MNKTPYEVAAEIARMLQTDPIAAAQVKEHLGEKRLLELLEIQPPMLIETKDEFEETKDNVVAFSKTQPSPPPDRLMDPVFVHEGDFPSKHIRVALAALAAMAILGAAVGCLLAYVQLGCGR